jgi:hypothetical protein
LAYAGWLTASLEIELRRLTTELDRNQKRHATLRREINKKYARIRYLNTRIDFIQTAIRYLEDELDKARGKPREKRVREELADVRASITPYIGERERIVEDIKFERFTYEIPLESRIRYLKEQIKLIEDELKKRPPIPVEEYIGPEETTGYSLFFNTETRKYSVRDPITKELLRTEDILIIETTASVETSIGHDIPETGPMLEITSITQVDETDSSEIDRITAAEGPIETGLITWLIHEGWGELARAFDTIDHAFLGKTEQPKRGYPCQPDDYPTIRLWMERRSRFVPHRRYPSTGCAEFEAE